MNDMTPSARFEKLLLDNERKAIFKFTASGQSHRPTFTATAEIDGITGISAAATDSTKKGAKHKACNLALKQIADGVGGHTWSSLDICFSGWRFEDYETQQVASEGADSPEHDNFNFVGALSEFGQKETAAKVTGPEYKDLDCKTTGQSRTFEVECNLYLVTADSNRHLTTTGTGSTKKSAKRQAAAEMYRLLVSEGRVLSVRPIQYHKPGEDSVISETIQTFSTEDEDVGTTEWDECETENQSAAQPDPQFPSSTDFFQLLQDLALYRNLTIEQQDVSPVPSGCFKCMISAIPDEASSDTTRVACGESATSFGDAKQAAAQKLIKIIQTE